ncbi:MAG: TIR domain-containing protein [Chloroflexota bacterium]|nr:TIR domain-containing protein [Chloroflexota bacterium]
MNDDRPYAFVSYASADRVRVRRVTDALAAAGLPLWLDEDSIDGGANYGPSIVAGIRDCVVLLLMCSPASMGSRNVRQEISIAWRHERPYLPLLIEATEFPEEVEYWLEGSQWLEILDQPVDAWLPQVLSALAKLGMPVSQASTPPRLPPAPARAIANLPVPPTALVGREHEVTELVALVGSARLVTLTGPGGIGKTRLMLDVANQLVGDFRDGLVLVTLAPIADATLVASTIAKTVGQREAGGKSIVAGLIDYLTPRQMLLILDNFEQVLAAAPLVGELLAGCPQLKVLVTSRAPLHLRGEHEYPIAPLPVPDEHVATEVERLSRFAAFALFVERARQTSHSFSVTADNAAAIAEICRRLEGLPLAIELAAARVKLLPPAAMLARLDRRLPLLTGGARDLPARQQTLRDTIGWSYDLLDGPHQRLFQTLAAFAGGSTPEAIEAVSDDDIDVLEGLSLLLDHSLVRQVAGPDDEPRFQMLETIREYGLEQLEAGERLPTVRTRQAQFFKSFAELAEPWLLGGERDPWLQRIEADHDNLRLVLRWCLDGNDPDTGQRIATALAWFWYLHGHFTEGRAWLETSVETSRSAPLSRARARSLTGVARLAFYQLDVSRERSLADESIAASREVDDTHGLAHALVVYGLAHRRERAIWIPALDESLRLFESVGDRWGVAHASLYSAAIGITGGLEREEIPTLRPRLEQAAAIFRELGDRWQYGGALNYLALMAEIEGSDDEAGRLHRKSIAIYRETSDRWRLMLALDRLGAFARRNGQIQESLTSYDEALAVSRELGIANPEIVALHDLGRTQCAENDADAAVETMGQAMALMFELPRMK